MAGRPRFYRLTASVRYGDLQPKPEAIDPTALLKIGQFGNGKAEFLGQFGTSLTDFIADLG